MVEAGNSETTHYKFIFRLSQKLRSRLAVEAERNRRSLTAELTARLEATFDADNETAELRKKNALLEAQVLQLQEALKANNGQAALMSRIKADKSFAEFVALIGELREVVHGYRPRNPPQRRDPKSE